MMALLIVLTLALGYANGANDVSKGIATLAGLPVSTTHALLGGRCGAGLATQGISGGLSPARLAGWRS